MASNQRFSRRQALLSGAALGGLVAMPSLFARTNRRPDSRTALCRAIVAHDGVSIWGEGRTVRPEMVSLSGAYNGK